MMPVAVCYDTVHLASALKGLTIVQQGSVFPLIRLSATFYHEGEGKKMFPTPLRERGRGEGAVLNNGVLSMKHIILLLCMGLLLISTTVTAADRVQQVKVM
jgi:hypothetical protein